MKVKMLFGQEMLGLELLAGELGLGRSIDKPDVHRPGLSLTGYLDGHSPERIMIFGRAEVAYLQNLSEQERALRLKAILSNRTPAVIVARGLQPAVELYALCERYEVPLFSSPLQTMALISCLNLLLVDAFAPTMTCHGSFVEVHGVGLLMQGESAIGKSEAALSLVDRGHRLISDDIVRVKRREGDFLEGSGLELSRGHIELRGIGILNLAHLYGIGSIREKKKIELVVKLEVWDDAHFYDRSGLIEVSTEILGVEIPYHVLPVKPGRDIALLIETLALNHRLKGQGRHSAQELETKLMLKMNHG